MNVPSQRTLFRQEAVEFQQHNRQWGAIVPLQPLSVRLTVWSMTAAVAFGAVADVVETGWRRSLWLVRRAVSGA